MRPPRAPLPETLPPLPPLPWAPPELSLPPLAVEPPLLVDPPLLVAPPLEPSLSVPGGALEQAEAAIRTMAKSAERRAVACTMKPVPARAMPPSLAHIGATGASLHWKIATKRG